jgi:hypothetical protein
MVTTFAAFQEAVDAPSKRPNWLVLIDGIPTDVAEWSTQHGVTQPVGTATIVLPPGPVPAQVQYGASVTIQAGYEGVVATVFAGTLPDASVTWSDGGTVATLNADGYGSWLNRGDHRDVAFPGPVSLKTIYNALAARRRIPTYQADDVTAPDGTSTIRLGGNPQVDGGSVIVLRRTSSQQWINGIGNLFGYYSFDLPSGPNRFQKVSGSPPASLAPVATYEQGVTGYSYARTGSLDGMVTYWEVKGARYTDADGVNVEIRSIAEAIPPAPELGPDQYVREEKSSSLLVSVQLADWVRNVLEIDRSTPQERVTWEDEGSPHVQPGDVVHVTAPAIGVDNRLWVMSVRHKSSDSGFYTTFEGWAGSGVALAAGQDCVVTPIPGGPWHIGDEHIAWYAVPAPSRAPIVIHFPVADYYSSLTIRGKGHGCNSYMLSGTNASSTVSRFEVWQFGEKVGEGNLPVLDEHYARRLPYGQTTPVRLEDGSVVPNGDYFWQALVIPITGQLTPDPMGENTELRIIPGRDTRVPQATGLDDCEVKNLSVTTCGVGEPTLPLELAA